MAKQPKVKCLYCGELIDREVEQFIKIKNRYAHFSCYEKKFKDEQKNKEEYRKLTDLIKDLYSPQEPNWNLITAQIKKYKDDGKTYMGMYYTLLYFFIIQKNDIHKSSGVGIIPYAYNRAKAYYNNADNLYAKATEINSKNELNTQQTENIITITNKKPNKKLLDFDY